MNFYNLVICDIDEDYSQSLISHITNGNDKTLQVYYCDTQEGVMAISGAKKISYLLISSKVPPVKRTMLDSDYTFVLTEEDHCILNKGEIPIFKYQRVDEILKTFYKETRKDSDFIVDVEKLSGEREVELLGIYSPGDKKSCSKYSRYLAKQMAKKSNVLYITTQVHVQEIGSDEEKDKSILDLIYYYRQEHNNLRAYLKDITKSQSGFDYICSSGFLEDIKEVPTKDWMGVIQLLVEKSYYEVIIVEISESIKGSYCVLSMCNEIHLPLSRDDYDNSSVVQFERELQRLNYTEILKRIKRKEIVM